MHRASGSQPLGFQQEVIMFRVICAKFLARKLVKLAEKRNDKKMIRVICCHQPSMDSFTDVYTPYKGKTKKMIQSLLKEADKLGLGVELVHPLSEYEEAVGREFLIEL